jgi:N-acetylmuramoyl-L-alanine amidase
MLLIIGAVALVAGQASAAAPARTLYADALVREQAVRTDLVGDQANAATLKDARAVVAAYEAIVRLYPASGYSDNALWQAGRLALDLFARFGQPQDKNSGVRLLHALETQYPTSKLAKGVGAELARPLAWPTLRAEQAPPLRVPVATIKNITRTVLPDTVRVTIELDAEVPFHEERLTDPVRVFVDLPSTRAAPALLDQTLRFEGDADLVRQIRIGRHPNSTTRVVLDAIGVASYSVYARYDPYRLVIDCARPAADPIAPLVSSAPPPLRRDTPRPLLMARRLTLDWGRRLPSIAPRALESLAAARNESEPAAALHAEVLSSPVATTPPARNLAGGLSIARQLGLSVSRIVIDPGHGGHDPGAKGKSVSEAELVLDVALRLEALLQKMSGVEVILTRRTDEFIPLQERTAIANREGADLFLSIHANASANAQARGIETYFLNFANNLGAAAVAARENAASGQTMGALPDLVKAIALNNKLDESRDFATQIQRAMLDRLKAANKTIKDLGVKQAPFVVLIGAAMPSVLAEISFVTNPQEARLLKSNAYRQRIAESLFNAIRKYQTSLKNGMSVAPQ